MIIQAVRELRISKLLKPGMLLIEVRSARGNVWLGNMSQTQRQIEPYWNNGSYQPKGVSIRSYHSNDEPAFIRLDMIGHLLIVDSEGMIGSTALTSGGRGTAFRADELWVAETAGRVIGTVGISLDDLSVAEVHHLRVEPGWRGRGVARLLVVTAAQRARECGCIKLVLEAEIATNRAVEVLDHLGFQYVGDKTGGDRRVLQFYLDLYRAQRRNASLD
jgi:GNAT superfamily N-acetyltransferase